MKCKLLQINFSPDQQFVTSVSKDVFDMHKERSIPNKNGFFYFPQTMKVEKAIAALKAEMYRGYKEEYELLARKMVLLFRHNQGA